MRPSHRLNTGAHVLVSLVALGLLWTQAARGQAGVSGVETHLAYTGEIVGVIDGGRKEGVVYLDNVDVITSVRSDSLTGWSGLTLFAYGLGNQGGSPSALVGDAQVTSNIEARLAWRLYEAWLQQEWGSSVSLLVGLYDLNAEFDVNRTGQLFLNSSHGIGASFGTSGRNGPSIFPVTSLAARLRVRATANGYVQAAVMDGVPGCPSDPVGTMIRFEEEEGVLAAAEIGTYLGREGTARGLVDRTVPIEARGKLALGAWAYSTELPEWTSVNRPRAVRRSRGSRGFYLLAEGQIFREASARDEGLSAFGRLGWANETHNRFSRYTGAGLVYTGLIPSRDADEVGVAAAVAQNGDAYRAAKRRGGPPTTEAETSLEATYSARLASWVTVAGDVQYVVNPNTSPTIPDAVVGAVRVVVRL